LENDEKSQNHSDWAQKMQIFGGIFVNEWVAMGARRGKCRVERRCGKPESQLASQSPPLPLYLSHFTVFGFSKEKGERREREDFWLRQFVMEGAKDVEWVGEGKGHSGKRANVECAGWKLFKCPFAFASFPIHPPPFLPFHLPFHLFPCREMDIFAILCVFSLLPIFPAFFCQKKNCAFGKKDEKTVCEKGTGKSLLILQPLFWLNPKNLHPQLAKCRGIFGHSFLY
jgi:hypothetical protein